MPYIVFAGLVHGCGGDALTGSFLSTNQENPQKDPTSNCMLHAAAETHTDDDTQRDKPW